jgi:hypothetical protein
LNKYFFIFLLVHIFRFIIEGPWSYGSWIFNNLCNQYIKCGFVLLIFLVLCCIFLFCLSLLCLGLNVVCDSAMPMFDCRFRFSVNISLSALLERLHVFLVWILYFSQQDVCFYIQIKLSWQIWAPILLCICYWHIFLKILIKWSPKDENGSSTLLFF